MSEANDKDKATKTYAGGCHCGKVTYEVTAAFEGAVQCNCSICAKKMPLLAFVPTAQFKLLSGQESLSDYQFNTKKIHHLFCSSCGVESFANGTAPDGSSMHAINLRCLEGFDASSLPVKHFDGKSM